MSSIPYVETYKIRGSICGIEDYTQGRKKDHFMADLPHKRFKSWFGGGGLGDSDTIEEARQKIADYATMLLEEDMVQMTLGLKEYTKLRQDGLTPFKEGPCTLPKSRRTANKSMSKR